jgi:hypothetical protein
MGVLATQGIDRSDRARRGLRRTAEHETFGPQGDDWVMASWQRAKRSCLIGMTAAIAAMEIPSRLRRSSWYDKFAHEVFNCMGNVFSRTSSVNHKALILTQLSGTTSVNKSG